MRRALDVARKLDESDPAGERVSLRELHAATTTFTEALRNDGVVDRTEIRHLDSDLLAAYARNVSYGVPEGPSYAVGDALLRLSRAIESALDQYLEPLASPSTIAEAVSKPPISILPSPGSWADSSCYFLMLDRFADGDTRNNGAGNVDYDPTDVDRSHGGDLRGVIDELDYIQSLGHNLIWLGPVTAQYGSQAYHGYHTYDFLGIDPRLGTIADLRELVDKAHERGMRIMLDVVWQHTAPVIDYEGDDVTFNDRGKRPYHRREGAPDLIPRELNDARSLYHARGTVRDWSDPEERVKGDFPTRPEEEARFLPALDTSDQTVQEAMATSVAYFVKQTGIDSLRLDTAGHFPPADHAAILSRLRGQLDEIGVENFNIVPEQYDGSWDGQKKYVRHLDDPERPYDGMLNFPQYFAFRGVFKEGQGTEALVDALRGQNEMVSPELAYNFLDNHDRPRFLHRCTGPDCCNGDPSRRQPNGGGVPELEAALALMYAWPGVPVVYYGTEQGFDGGEDPHNREDMRFGSGDSRIAERLQKLNELREKLPELRRGRAIPLFGGASERLFAMARQYDGRGTIAAVNTGGMPTVPRRLTLETAGAFRAGDQLVDELSGETFAVQASKDGTPFVRVPRLAPYQAMLLAHVDRSSRLADGPTSVRNLDLTPAGPVTPSPEHWEDHRFYFAFVDRFANGDPSNDRAGFSDFDPADPVGAHGGDIRGVIDKLDYIQALGCNAIWINPVAQNHDAYHGYATIHAMAVDPARGTAEELRELVDECHRRGMRVILDVVANHTAHVREYPEGREDFADGPIVGTRFASDKPRPLPEELRRARAYHDRGMLADWQDRDHAMNGDFPGGLSDLNTEDPETTEALIKIYQWWIARFDIDGFRVDTVKHAPRSFWDKFNAGVIEFARSLGKENFLLMPEVLEGHPRNQAWALETTLGDGSVHESGPLNHPLFFALKEAFTGRAPGSKIGDVLREMTSHFAAPTLAGNFADSHDFPRFLHDVDGNRRAYEAALATVFAAPGMPIVYYGSEQGFEGGEDPWNREDMFANPALRYRTVPHPGADHFDETSPLFATIRELNNLRAKIPELRYGDTEVRWGRRDRPSAFAFARKLEGSEVVFAANPTARADRMDRLSLDPAVFSPGDRLVDALHPERILTVAGTRSAPCVDLTLAPHSAALLVEAVSSRTVGTDPVDPAPAPAAARERPVIYQLMVRTFGNVRGVNRFNGSRDENGVGKFSDVNDAALDEIKRQGHTHVYLTGVLRHATATDYSDIGLPADDPDILKGRAGSPWAIKDYFDVDPDLAVDPEQRLEEFRDLVERVKAKGLKVMIDMVPNHVARSYESVVRPELSFGASDDQSKFFDPENNFFYLQDQPGHPLAIHRDPSRAPGADGRFEREDGSPGHTPRVTGNNRAAYDVGENDWCETVKLNYGFNPFTGEKRFDPLPDTWTKMDEVIRYWQEMGVDGFRVDYAHVVPLEFWRWATRRAKHRNPEFTFVGEAYEKSPDKVPGFTLEKLIDAGFDAVYHAELYHGLREVVAGPKWANDIDGWLSEHEAIEDHLVRYAENHDEPRIAAPVRDDLHNSGLGDPKAGRPLAAILFLAGRGPNLLYNGQEVGEPAVGAEGFGGDDARTTIFDYWTMPAHARWVGADHSYRGSALSEDEKSLRDFYRRVNELARSPVFAAGERESLQDFNREQVDYGSGEHVYSFVRYDEEGRRALVVANFSGEESLRPTVRIPAATLRRMGLDGNQRVELNTALGAAPSHDTLSASALSIHGVAVELEPFGISVIQLDDVE